MSTGEKNYVFFNILDSVDYATLSWNMYHYADLSLGNLLWIILQVVCFQKQLETLNTSGLGKFAKICENAALVKQINSHSPNPDLVRSKVLGTFLNGERKA